MREFKLEPYYTPEARREYVGLTEISQADVNSRVEFLTAHPEPDGEITFAWPEEGPNVFIFLDHAWILIYALQDDASVLEIQALAPRDESVGNP